MDKRLGKGGFGQVYLGKRLPRRTSARDTKPQQVAVKFEHVSSKGCHNGPPPEWAVYKYACVLLLISWWCTAMFLSALGDTYGVPKLYYKGQADNFYIMVRMVVLYTRSLICLTCRRSWRCSGRVCGTCGTKTANACLSST